MCHTYLLGPLHFFILLEVPLYCWKYHYIAGSTTILLEVPLYCWKYTTLEASTDALILPLQVWVLILPRNIFLSIINQSIKGDTINKLDSPIGDLSIWGSDKRHHIIINGFCAINLSMYITSSSLSLCT